MAEFIIPQKVKKDGKEKIVGGQAISISNETENMIHIGKNLTDGNGAMFSIVCMDGKKYLSINKSCPQYESLKQLEEFADLDNESNLILNISKINMHSNEDFSFELTDKDSRSFGKITIGSNTVILTKNETKTTLLNLGENFMDVDLPKNIVELTDGDKAPIAIKSGLPSQMFDALKEMGEVEGSKISTAELTNLGKKKNQTLKIVRWGEKVFIADGVEMKEVQAGVKVVLDKDDSGKDNGRKDLIIKFGKTSSKVGETTDAKLVDGLTDDEVLHVLEVLPTKSKDGSAFAQDDLSPEIEGLQINKISRIKNPKDKTQFAKSDERSFSISSESTAETAAIEPSKIEDAPEAVEESTTEETGIEEPITEESKTEEPAPEEPEQEEPKDEQEPDETTTVVKEVVKKHVPFPHLAKYILKGLLVLAAAALTVLGILGGVGLWAPIFAGLTTITTATSFGVDLKRDIAEYAQKKAEAPTEERIKKVVSKDKDKNKDKNKDKDKDKDKTKKNKKDKTKDKTKDKAKDKAKDKEKAKSTSSKETESTTEVIEGKTASTEASEGKTKTTDEAKLKPEEMASNLNTIRKSTEKTIKELEEYNAVWGKDAKTEEKINLLNDSKTCVEELKDFRDTLPAETETVEEIRYSEIVNNQKGIKERFGSTISAVRKVLGMEKTSEL